MVLKFNAEKSKKNKIKIRKPKCFEYMVIQRIVELY